VKKLETLGGTLSNEIDGPEENVVFTMPRELRDFSADKPGS